MIPSKSQCETALEKANHVRIYRAQLKRQINAREITVHEVLASSPWEIATMRVFDLLTAQPRWARFKASTFMSRVLLAESLTVEQMSKAQEERLLRGLAARGPDAREIQRQVARWQRPRSAA